MDGHLRCININGHATNHVHISCQGQYGKILDQLSKLKGKRESIAFQKIERTIMHGEKVRYSESVIIHLFGVINRKCKKGI